MKQDVSDAWAHTAPKFSLPGVKMKQVDVFGSIDVTIAEDSHFVA
jgi:hypothetical protein